MAGRIPQAFIDDVVARSDIVEIIGIFVLHFTDHI